MNVRFELFEIESFHWHTIPDCVLLLAEEPERLLNFRIGR